MARKLGIGLLSAGLALTFTTGCIGQMAVSGKVREFNLSVAESKWLREAVFLGLYLIPVYPFAAGADLIIFNSIEFHTGTNPLTGEPRIARAGDVYRAESGGLLAESTLREDGSIDLRVVDGAGPAHELNLARDGDRAVARDSDGRVIAFVDAEGRVVSRIERAR